METKVVLAHGVMYAAASLFDRSIFFAHDEGSC